MLGFAAVLLLSACSPSVPDVALETATPTATSTNTPVWFPPTATYTPSPTRAASPTAGPLEAVGELLLADTFGDDANWATNNSGSSSAVIANGRITLTTQIANAVVLSTRSEPVFSDFYAQIIVSPSLCDGEDEYGFIFRADPEGEHYRFTLSCDGRAKLDRYRNGTQIPSITWVEHNAIPRVAPSKSTLAVWAQESELRFFVNDTLVFTASDTVLYEGLLGVFIRSRGEGTLSVSFSDLQVWALEE